MFGDGRHVGLSEERSAVPGIQRVEHALARRAGGCSGHTPVAVRVPGELSEIALKRGYPARNILDNAMGRSFAARGSTLERISTRAYWSPSRRASKSRTRRWRSTEEGYGTSDRTRTNGEASRRLATRSTPTRRPSTRCEPHSAFDRKSPRELARRYRETFNSQKIAY